MPSLATGFESIRTTLHNAFLLSLSHNSIQDSGKITTFGSIPNFVKAETDQSNSLSKNEYGAVLYITGFPEFHCCKLKVSL